MSIETVYHILFSGALIWFSILIFAMLLRAIHGPRITDRLLSINMIGTMVISCIVILSRLFGESYLVDVALIYAMISFVSVLIMAMTYIPSGKRRGKFSQQARGEYLKEHGGNPEPDQKVREETAGYPSDAVGKEPVLQDNTGN